MGWVKLSDNYYRHPKFDDLSCHAELLWLRGLCYSNEHETDGALPARLARVGGQMDVHRSTLARAADQLVDAGLWARTERGYQIHDYHDYQPSKEEKSQRRAKDKARVVKWRAGHAPSGNGVTNGVTPPVTDDEFL